MKRELAAAALLLCLFGAARLNIAHADKLIDLLSLNLVRSENAARIGEYTTALTDLDNALSLWEKSRDYSWGILLQTTAELEDEYESISYEDASNLRANYVAEALEYIPFEN